MDWYRTYIAGVFALVTERKDDINDTLIRTYLISYFYVFFYFCGFYDWFQAMTLTRIKYWKS